MSLGTADLACAQEDFMLGSINIVAFVPTRDREKSRAFYEGVLGLRFVKDDGFATVMDANGIMVRVGTVPADFSRHSSRFSGGRLQTSRKSLLRFRAKEFTSSVLVFSNRTNLAYGPLRTEIRSPGSKTRTAISCLFRNTRSGSFAAVFYSACGTINPRSIR